MTDAAMLEKLLESGKIDVGVLERAKLEVMEEELIEHNITAPKITKREEANRTRFVCVLPKSQSKDGKRHQITGATYEECKEKWIKAASVCLEYNAKRAEVPETLNELMEEWMSKKKDSIKPQTVSGYHSHYENHIKNSAFGQYKIQDIKLPECEGFINYLTNKRETKNGRQVGLSYDTLRHIKSEVSMALDYAVSHEYIVSNHMDAVKINQGLCCTKRRHQTEAWTDDELRAIEECSTREWKRNRKYRQSAAILILAFTGMRAGELVGATWDDVDFVKGTFTIESTYTSYKDYESGKFITGSSTPKTPDSRRTIELNDSALYWLKEMKRRNEQLGIRSNRIIVSKRGRVTNQRDLNIRFEVFCKAVGIPYKSTHAGRRTYASILLENNIPLPEVSADLGHKKNSTTLDTYYKGRSKRDTMALKKNQIFLATSGNTLESVKEA